MRSKIAFKTALLSLGIALLLAALFFDKGTAVSTRPQAASTPTPDRLAQPTLPASPSQADHGAQVYWLSCLPCHGDRGQGLTEEFRQTYPPEEQYCWNSGCHGARPYDQGFSLPTQIPAVIGAGALQKFPNAVVLHAYIAAAMPFWKPGSLSDEDAWSVTAFVLRQNGLWDGKGELSSANAEAILVGPPPPVPTSTPHPASAGATAGIPFSLILGGVVLLGAVVLLVRFIRRASPPEG